MALWYVQSTATPKVLAGSEVIPDSDPALNNKLTKWWLDIVSKATRLSLANDVFTPYNQRPTSFIRLKTLCAETLEPPWGVTHTMNKVGLLGRLHRHTCPPSMATTRVSANITKGSIWSSLDRALHASALGDLRRYTSRKWAEKMRWSKRSLTRQFKRVSCQTTTAGDGDYFGVVASRGPQPVGGSVSLAKVVPDRRHRLSIRKLRLGMIGDTVSHQSMQAGA